MEQSENVQLLRDRFRLDLITIAEAQAQKLGLTISQPVMAAMAELTQKYTEQVAKDLELFAHHAGRKSVNMDDVVLAAHRNEEVMTTLKKMSQNLLKNKEQQAAERKRKKPPAGQKNH